MRGAMRVQVMLILATSGAVAGGLVGFALGLLPLADITPLVAIPAALLDALRVPTLAMRTQVPQYWGRIFPARTVALLYGARLGVGPLTILPTWLWWAAMLVGVSRGPWAGMRTGASFAVARTVTMWAAGTRARRLDGADRALRLAIAVLALSALAACGGDDDDAGPTTTSSVPEIDLVPSTTTTTTAEDAALTDRLLTDALPGFARVDDEVLDLDAAAEAEADPEAERALLETRGFVRGVARRWSNADGDVVYVASYELGSPDQADLYLVDGAETLTARSAMPFDVADVPGAFGFTTTEDTFVAHAVAFTRGSRWFLVIAGSSTATRTEEEAIELAVAQAELAS